MFDSDTAEITFIHGHILQQVTVTVCVVVAATTWTGSKISKCRMVLQQIIYYKC